MEEKKLTVEELLMNVLADCGRIERILIIADCDGNNGLYETWSNNLDLVERAGMLKVATVRNDRAITIMKEIND